nr:D-alanyl-D-alanine carboxypeptidase family protein [Corynebacterium lactis]
MFASHRAAPKPDSSASLSAALGATQAPARALLSLALTAGIGLSGVAAPAPVALAQEQQLASPESAQPGPELLKRDTSACPFRTLPPPPVDTSEVPKPGEKSPSPLPVPAEPVGGPKMAQCDTVAGTGFAVPTDVPASAWTVFDLKTGEILAAKDPHGRYRPASVIKVLMALVAIDELDMTRKVRATFDDAAIEGSRVGIVEGVDYTVETLLTGLLLNSGNDCGHALSRMLGGMDTTLEKVNRKARELGATDTRVANPTGLDAPGQMTSAYDMSLFFREAFANPTYRKLSAITLAKVPGNKDLHVDDFDIANDNQLLASGFEGALGGKTGFTDDARHTFAGIAERDGRSLGTIILDTTTHEAPRPWQQAASLLEAGFATPKGASVGTLNIAGAPRTGAAADSASGSGSGSADEKTDPGNPASARSSWTSIGIGAGVVAIIFLAAASTWAVGKRRR